MSAPQCPKCTTILLDPGRRIEQTGAGHICGLRLSSTGAASIDRGTGKCRGECDCARLGNRSVPITSRSPQYPCAALRLRPLVLLARWRCRAAATSRRSRRPPRPPPVTVAQPVKRTVTDWDEFTGRFEAVEEVQIRARVGGFVTPSSSGTATSSSRRSALCDRSRALRGGRRAGGRPACGCARQGGAGQARTRPRA